MKRAVKAAEARLAALLLGSAIRALSAWAKLTGRNSGAGTRPRGAPA